MTSLRPARSRATLAALAALMLSAGRAQAETALEGCPSEGEFREALAKLAPKREAHFDFESEAAEATVQDLGASFRVSVGDRVRDYEDPARDCARRARTAAVFVGLVLWPADPEAEETAAPVSEAVSSPASPKPAQPKPAAPPPRSASLRHLWLSGAGAGEAGLADDLPVQVLGRLSVAYLFDGRYGVSAFGAWPLVSAELPVGPVPGELTRVLLGLGVRGRVEVAPFALAADAAFSGALVTVRRNDGGGEAHGFEPGARLALLAALDGPLTPELGLHAEWVPVPHVLALTPSGKVGEMPRLWLGATLGLAVGFW